MTADDVLAHANKLKLANSRWTWGMCVEQALGHYGVAFPGLAKQEVVQMRTWRKIETLLGEAA